VRRRLILTALAGMALAVGLATLAIADRTPYVSTCLRSKTYAENSCPGRVIVDFGGTVVPKVLPRHEFVSVAMRLRGKVSTEHGAPPPALREVTIDLDRSIRLEDEGLPACQGSTYAIRRPPGVPMCDGKTRVGTGRAHIEIAFPEVAPVRLASRLTLYSGGVEDGVTILFAVAPITVPVPTDVVIPIEIHRLDESPYGLQAVAKIPVIAGGSGRIVDFTLGIKRLFTRMGKQESLVSARCPRDRLDVAISAVLRNDAGEPGVPSTTLVKGGMELPCAAKG
jgi:hypothetical protein